MTKLAVRNPRTGEADYYITPPSSEELSNSCRALRNAQDEWQQLGVNGRADVMQKWKTAIECRKEEIIAELVKDTGRHSETILEFNSIPAMIDRWCNLAPEILKAEDRITSSIPFLQIEGEYKPYSLVGVISPWNFPLLLSLIDAIPALLAGSAVIIKPSEFTPRFIEPLLETIADVPVLQGVLNVVTGAGETGRDIVNEVDLVAFTGSVKTGRLVGEACSKRFIPVSLELGGKDAAIVLKSADLDRATSAILWGSVANSGQSCLSIERTYVEDEVFDDFVELLVQKAKKLQLAHPNVEDGHIGPIITKMQANTIQQQLMDAADKGAIIHCGGEIEEHSGGLWCLPTVLTDVDHEMKIMVEETFGPVLPIMRVKDERQAVEFANNTNFGLGGAVFAGTEEKAIEVASQLEAGAISINDAALTAIMYEGEKNSFKFSGLGGSRMGSASIKRFIRKKAFLINTGVKDPWWYDV
ncbi:aldehyde dehydrogenase family protein [Sporosarcina sp. GW1-11]|uniref:aldehyde dehydrogenase family protein n=1 Tax=Sporosarcina sp. GW1-11 TaxID=2899126 RepID=UPI00294ED165|nr:aldehyde dehydrogenase family protein [Sporosarcina sp. GW1-11]MDV6378662.1 aldehyde dehydrogenase family protein [Sporosarcina sp. GW1-11]